VNTPTDDARLRFLSEEDVDLASLSEQEFAALSRAALEAMQASNDADKHCYSHGCIAVEPGFEYLLPRIRSGVL
jgi:hypothetical protein